MYSLTREVDVWIGNEDCRRGKGHFTAVVLRYAVDRCEELRSTWAGGREGKSRIGYSHF